jgi:hypothetical protein
MFLSLSRHNLSAVIFTIVMLNVIEDIQLYVYLLQSAEYIFFSTNAVPLAVAFLLFSGNN